MSNPVIAKLTIEVENSMIAACRDRLPLECCGVVYGSLEEEHTVAVEGYSIIRNAAASPENRFSFDTEDWIAACYEAQKNQRRLVGVFHSHPVGTGEPSASDARTLMPWDSYWIVSFADGQGAISAYRHDARHGFVSLSVERVT
ncbi:M67 family metallopeptidase [Cohnella sp. GCM10027633]|uniref:M67 family metallopeptidase n=1 Tax=unclassified Cohnella TaxID=2636738 RepID=UPI003637FCE6